MEKTTKNIYQKLLEIQQSINGLAKDSKSFTYGYVSGTKVLEHIKPLMNKLGLLLKQEVIGITNERQDYSLIQKDGIEKRKSEILTKVEMRFTWVDCETGQTDINLFAANGQNDWEKGLGSALTYGERYFLLKYFHLATDADDIDNPQRKDDTATSFNNDYSEWKSELAKCKTIADLNNVFTKNKAVVEANKEIKALFSERKSQLTKAA